MEFKNIIEIIIFGIIYISLQTIVIWIAVRIAIRAIKDELFENNYLHLYKEKTTKDQHREEWKRWKQDREYEEYLQWKRKKDAVNK